VELILIEDYIKEKREELSGKRYYTLQDVYLNADLVTYPSGYEGFGNAFLEAVYYKKMVVVNRYSIYIADIEPLGFEVVSFEGFITEKVVEDVYRYLENKKLLSSATEKNYMLAKENFSFSVLERKLIPLVKNY